MEVILNGPDCSLYRAKAAGRDQFKVGRSEIPDVVKRRPSKKVSSLSAFDPPLR